MGDFTRRFHTIDGARERDISQYITCQVILEYDKQLIATMQDFLVVTARSKIPLDTVLEINVAAGWQVLKGKHQGGQSYRRGRELDVTAVGY